MIPRTSTEWLWFILTTFVLAVGINLLSAYLKPAIDRWLGRYFDHRRISSEKERKRTDETVQWMLASPAAAMLVSNGITRRFIYFLFAVLVAFIGIVAAPSPTSLPQYFGLWGIVALIVGLSVMGNVADMAFLARCLRRYTDLDRERHMPPDTSATDGE